MDEYQEKLSGAEGSTPIGAFEERQCLTSRLCLQPDGCGETNKILELKLQAGGAFWTSHGSCFDHRVSQGGASAWDAREQSEQRFEAVLRLQSSVVAQCCQ